MEDVNPHEELKRLDEQIKSATELAALKPLYYRLHEIMRAFPDDFDVQFSGNEIQQRLMAHGTLLKQREASPPAPPAPLPPAMPAAEPPPLPVSLPDTVAPAPGAPPGTALDAHGDAVAAATPNLRLRFAGTAAARSRRDT